MDSRLPLTLLLCGVLLGCGTTKWTDTSRSATEQLLITDAMDRAVSRLDLRSLAGKTVFLDSLPLAGLTDSSYLVSSLRQHLLASGCVVAETKAEAKYVVEARAGAIGTDHHELTYGVPRVDIPAILPVSGFGIPTNIPELPFIKRMDQRAVTKIAVFAYNRETGRPVWQSGAIPMESDAKALWVFGAGPFERGSIYEGTNFAGGQLKIPLVELGQPQDGIGSVSVADEAYFIEPKEKGADEELAQGEGEAAPDAASDPSPPGESTEPAAPSAEVIQTAHESTAHGGEAASPPAETLPSGEPASEAPPPMGSPAWPTIREPVTKAPPPDGLPIDSPAPLPPAIGASGEPLDPFEE
ncbi:MAG: DUF6655 family protein [Planctomycetota bacterium]